MPLMHLILALVVSLFVVNYIVIIVDLSLESRSAALLYENALFLTNRRRLILSLCIPGYVSIMLIYLLLKSFTLDTLRIIKNVIAIIKENK